MTTKELTMPTGGTGTKRVQEWLCHHGCNVVVDGIEGPATRAAIREFQVRRSVREDGMGGLTWAKLVEPMRLALAPTQPIPPDSLSRLVVVTATRHLQQRPREIGGENRGPWVRLYMKGHEGREWPWCAGFATLILQQAAEQIGMKPPLDIIFGCDTIVDVARERGIFMEKVRPSPGWLFLVPGRKHHWSHIGIVVGTDGAATMTTIEGNTNDSGSPEGFEVCRRTRTISGMGFVRI